MLIIKVFVNEKQIDEINIRNMGISNKKGYRKYEVEYKGFYFNLWHDRGKGWKSLTERVFKRIRKGGKKNERISNV